MSKNILGIDAMNIRDGGGLTHLREILTHIDTNTLLFNQVIVWGNAQCLQALPNQPWLIKVQPLSKRDGFISTTWWQVFHLARESKKMNCSLLFIAGGSAFTSFRPYVTICHNMLPFTKMALKQYAIGLRRFKFLVLLQIQLFTFQHSKGVIFLSNWALEQLQPLIAEPTLQYAVIPHGINPGFFIKNRLHRSIADCDASNPFSIIYVSRIEPYKNQLFVIEQLSNLRKATGWPIRLVLAGLASDPSYFQKMLQLIKTLQNETHWIDYKGAVPYETLGSLYSGADMAVFASTCENMPIILLEKMAAGLPIICSDTTPMPDFLQDAGVYTQMEDGRDFQSKVQLLIENREYRRWFSEKAQQQAVAYNWTTAASNTFDFLFSCQ
ncbi:MAG: glycosyltransferase family 4 protein [Sediminibacterium sp.]|nr:glycosyltransferase family 4 protein [Sediminibacterium sp.]